MPRLPLLGGAYSTRSVIANCQRAINYYPELNSKDAPVPTTHYQRPGLRPLVTPGVPGRGRGVFRASNGQGYAVVGQNVYSVSASWVMTLIGTLTTVLPNPVSMTDNGVTALLADGSTLGYTIDLATNGFAVLSDPSGSFTGADKVDYIDTFVIWNRPGTKEFGSTLSNVMSFDPLYFGVKTNYPDLLQTLVVNRHELLLIGQLKTEIWYDAGIATFPFAELPGAYHEHGTVAKYSVASADISVFWLTQDLQGQGMVVRARGYQCTRISNHGLEYQIRKMANTVGISDAVGYTYQQDGHVFYVLHFPAGNQTWVFDDAVGEPTLAWHQECWTDGNGTLNRHRGNGAAFLHGVNVCIDWENGTLYAMDLDRYTDTVNGVVFPLTCIRTFPHIGTGMSVPGPMGVRPELADGKRVQYHQFQADLDCGLAPLDVSGNPAVVSLRYSDDRGHTFSDDVLQSAGEPGQYLTQPSWRGLGIARDRVFELMHSIDGPAALNGAWVNGTVLES